MRSEVTPQFVDAFEQIRIYLVTLESWSFSGDVCSFDFTFVGDGGLTESLVSLTLSSIESYSFRVRGEKEESTDILDLTITRMEEDRADEHLADTHTEREHRYEFFLISSYIVFTVTFGVLDIGNLRSVGSVPNR